VFVHGEIWDAVSSAPLEAGESVIVRDVDGLVLRVEPLTAAQRSHAPAIS
jgi:membrane-bound ClpP family serine protease